MYTLKGPAKTVRIMQSSDKPMFNTKKDTMENGYDRQLDKTKLTHYCIFV